MITLGQQLSAEPMYPGAPIRVPVGTPVPLSIMNEMERQKFHGDSMQGPGVSPALVQELDSSLKKAGT